MFPTFEAYLSNREFQIFVSFIIALFISFQSIPVIINISQLVGVVQNPVKRSSHSSPTPTFGGIGIFAATLIAFLIWQNQGEESLIHKTLAGLIILFFLGMKDDLYSLAPTKKILLEVVASSILIFGADLRIYSFFGIFGVHQIPYLVSAAITLFIFIAMINAMNLIDGIDGLAGGIGMIASAGFGFWFYLHDHFSLACLAFSLAGSLIGFLRYNMSIKNKVFMGDTGSLLVGFLLTVFAVKFIHLNTAYPLDPTAMYTAPIIAIFVLVVPIFDTLRVFSIRIISRESPFKADRNHMHHLLIDNNFSHNQATILLCTLTLFLTVAAYLSRQFFSNTQLFYIIIGLFCSYCLTADYLDKLRKANKEKLNNFYGNKTLVNSLNINKTIETDNN